MADSFEIINYNLRPNKCIERKMICEMLGRLVVFDDKSNYRYIGFGSTFFTDFILIHKTLSINDMVSIEKSDGKRGRFELNKPYACIELLFGHSNTILPNLQLNKKKNIIWLDYDDPINEGVFVDIDTIVTTAMPGSIFMISVNIEDKFKTSDERYENIVERVGERRIPIEINTNKSIGKTDYQNLVYKMIDMQIKSSLLNRSGKEADNNYRYMQLLNFRYRDGALMLTIGGIVFDITQDSLIDQMKLSDFVFYKDKSEPYIIDCPIITPKELRMLNELFPCEIELSEKGKIKPSILNKIPLPSNDIVNLSKLYRYYPYYAETIL